LGDVGDHPPEAIRETASAAKVEGLHEELAEGMGGLENIRTNQRIREGGSQSRKEGKLGKNSV
jgi:hypothetical protein